MKHHASPEFWQRYRTLPVAIRRLADGCFEQLKQNANYPSLHFKKVGRFWSVRVGAHYRAIGVQSSEEMLWFWIGSHADYDKMIG